MINLGTHKIFTSEIVNHNSLGMCCEKTCSRPYSEFVYLKLNGMDLIVPVCRVHADLLEGVD